MKPLQLLSSIFPTLVGLRSVSHVHLSAWVFKRHKNGFKVHSYFILLRYCSADGLPVIHTLSRRKSPMSMDFPDESCFQWKGFLFLCWAKGLIHSITSFPVRQLWNMVVVLLQTEETWWKAILTLHFWRQFFTDSALSLLVCNQRVEITSVKCWALWCSGLFGSP